MNPKNITYRSPALAQFYSSHRRRWSDYYPSERWIFEKIASERGNLGCVLDVGCAAGGLAEALAERFSVRDSFVGVEINAEAAEIAQAMAPTLPMPAEFITADICACPQLADRQFDLVVSLSVADWNADTLGILAACWDHVAPGGHLVISLRLTPNASLRDPEQSYQFIWFSEAPIPADTEKAPYVVFNTAEAVQLLSSQQPKPDRIVAYGYWGKPSSTARVPYDRLVFSVFAVRKAPGSQPATQTEVETRLPADAFSAAK